MTCRERGGDTQIFCSLLVENDGEFHQYANYYPNSRRTASWGPSRKLENLSISPDKVFLLLWVFKNDGLWPVVQSCVKYIYRYLRTKKLPGFVTLTWTVLYQDPRMVLDLASEFFLSMEEKKDVQHHPLKLAGSMEALDWLGQ